MHASAPSQIRFLSDLNEREHAKKDQDMRHEVAELKKVIALKDEALSKKDLRIQKLTNKLLDIE